MKIIIGLGNPGVKYENTRHNAGFMVLDKLAQKCNLEFNQEKFSAYFAKGKVKGEDVILLKPTTYMNNSGFALRQCPDFYKVGMENVIVIYDDVDLPVGKLRLRQKEVQVDIMVLRASYPAVFPMNLIVFVLA